MPQSSFSRLSIPIRLNNFDIVDDLLDIQFRTSAILFNLFNLTLENFIGPVGRTHVV